PTHADGHARKGTPEFLGRALRADAAGPPAPVLTVRAAPVLRARPAQGAVRSGGFRGRQGPVAGVAPGTAAALDAGERGGESGPRHLHEHRPRLQCRAELLPGETRDPRVSDPAFEFPDEFVRNPYARGALAHDGAD